MFVVEQILEGRLPDTDATWIVLVCNGRWIYQRASDAEQVVQRCQPDHEDEIRCQYRVREITSEEALQLALKVEAQDAPFSLCVTGMP